MLQSSAAFQWAIPESDGGSPITNYVIEYRKVGDKKWLKANKGEVISDTNFTLSGTAEEVDYEFRVAAENKAGIGPYSPPSEPRRYGRQHKIIYI